jgi:hypothetical protein
MMKLVLRLMVCVALVLPATASAAQGEKHPTNACGCYGDGSSCMCKKGAKCGCPGECEPKGCEEERQKKFQKELEEEVRKAKEDEKARTKPKEEAKPVDEEEEETATTPSEKESVSATSKGKGKDKDKDKGKEKGTEKAKPIRKMKAAQKKQLQKLIDAYLAENPDGGKRTLTELRSEL